MAKWGRAGIHAKYVLICVVKPIGVDAKSENVPVSQNYMYKSIRSSVLHF